MDGSNSGMSDERRAEPQFADPDDAGAPTERDPRVHGPSSGMPARGVALSVLWWLEGDAETAKRG
jgi:hypothetical protein